METTIINNTRAVICPYKMIGRTALILVFNFVLQLVACPSWGQVLQKKELTPSDYHLWSQLHLDNIAPNEQWTSYRLSYSDDSDSLFVRNVNSKTSYSFTGIETSKFTDDNYFLAGHSSDLYILNLKTAGKEKVENIIQYDYSEATGLLLIVRLKEHKNLMTIRTPSGRLIKEIPDVSRFSLSPDGRNIVFASKENDKNAVRILDLKQFDTEKWIILNAKDPIKGFAWQKKGHSVAFFSSNEQKEVNSVFHYLLKQDKLYVLNAGSKTEFPLDSLSIFRSPELHVSDDMQRVFFNVLSNNIPEKSKSESNVEVWNGNDKWLYLDDAKHGRFETALKNAVWIPERNLFRQLSTNELPIITLSGNKDFAILSNPKDYEPQPEFDSPRDYYLLDLKTFEKSLFLKKIANERYNVNASPGGKYVSYFKEGAWWVYSLKDKKHTNLTLNIPTKFTARELFFTRESVCGNPGWTIDDKEILLYDQYDVWAVSPDGTSYRRLTKGKESKIKFRMAEVPNKFHYVSIYEENHLESYDLDKELLLRAVGEDHKSGFFTWTSKKKEKKIVYLDSYIDQLFYSPKRQKFFFKEQKFDLSPRLVEADRSAHYKPFFQSNPQQQNYYWGKSELIRYQNSKGIDLRGALLYPANYDPTKKYPMIVEIYELISKEMHYYKNPSLYNEDGFNRTNFSADGYFILLPDITQEYRNVGTSLVDCVTSAVDKVLERNIINPDKIGLIGFSSGGYETAFTITQTNRFATAIAGGTNADLRSLYFSIGNGTGKSEMWRFQSTYWMLEKTPFQAPELYDASSPLFHVQKVQTPLLLWTGKNDPQVDPHQSMAFYLALRSFKKKVIMLQYPKETHVISNPVNQSDITSRMHNWFDFFLKDVPCDWVENGIR
ncbi:alpha/beta hydrolase family protein [Flavobacterium sp. 245]|uniref:alpha/beta hydrolase family protein n=1 Tax=Flavobacterium sp. 245 TaxID=2512115 RepID=UPI001060E1F7|nr:prolyl oligopeptidase family serine peptidase [Flavobacterium sp. 245]TDO96078.1 dipeptidyl aminopeptidase/acylaminoacyl peptidase [Flavobacterium sp. 245]